MYQGPSTRRNKREALRLITKEADRKPGGLKPFRRAAEMYTKIMEMKAAWPPNDMIGLQMAINQYPPYTSRGHGWGKHVTSRRIDGRWVQDRSKYNPAECMAQGCR